MKPSADWLIWSCLHALFWVWHRLVTSSTDKHYSVACEDDFRSGCRNVRASFRTNLTWTIMSRYFPAFQEQKWCSVSAREMRGIVCERFVLAKLIYSSSSARRKSNSFRFVFLSCENAFNVPVVILKCGFSQVCFLTTRSLLRGRHYVHDQMRRELFHIHNISILSPWNWRPISGVPRRRFSLVAAGFFPEGHLDECFRTQKGRYGGGRVGKKAGQGRYGRVYTGRKACVPRPMSRPPPLPDEHALYTENFATGPGMHSLSPWQRSFKCWPKGEWPLPTECRKRSWECLKSLLTSHNVVEMW